MKIQIVLHEQMIRKAFAIHITQMSPPGITMTGQSHPAKLIESIFLVSEAVASLGPVNVRAT